MAVPDLYSTIVPNFDELRKKADESNEQVYKQTKTNPPFELLRNWSHSAGPFAGRVQRGALVTKYPDDDGTLWMLYFMLNPSVVSQSFLVDTGQIYSAANSSAADRAAEAYGKSRMMQLALMFDRSLEVAQNEGHRGVEVDIEVFLRLLGIEDIHNDIPSTVHVVKAYIARSNDTMYGVGGSDRGDSVVNLEGWITSADVTYTSFAWTMTPTRAVVNISLEQVLRGSEDTENVPSSDSDDGVRSEISQSRNIIENLS